MYNQSHACQSKQATTNSLPDRARFFVSTQQIQVVAMSSPAWKSVARFLSQAAVGGALGAYALVIRLALYDYRTDYKLLLLLTFPFALVGGAVLGLLTGALTLLVENLIEEKLSALPRVIVTAAITVLIVFGIATLWKSASWQLLKTLMLPGAILGLPVGLVARSRLRFWRVLLLGVDKPPGEEAHAVSEATSIAYGFALIGGFALRLVGVIGVLVAGMVLACCWKVLQTDEVMVTIFVIYYFACTAYITSIVRHRWAIAAAGTFLNTLLLLLALLWDPYAAPGLPGPFTVAFFVLAFLWMLFAGGHLWVEPQKRSGWQSVLER
jgi:hypothetical protein